MSRKRQRTDNQSPENPGQGLRLTRSKACTECKNQKTKCEIKQGETSCVRCLRQGLDCVSYDVSQQFLQNDATWKSETTSEVQMLRKAVQHLLRHTHQPELSTFANVPTADSPRPGPIAEYNTANATTGIDMSRENTPQPQEDESPGIITAPMANLYELTRLKNLRNNPGSKPRSSLINQDFISQGVISVEEANFLFDRFMQSNNKMLWDGILLHHTELDAIRRSSTMLAAVVLTVGALHTPGRTEVFQKCYDVFVSLVCSSALSRNHVADDVRALCIGAFYLANLSWKLSGQATRIAAEIGLHRSFDQYMHFDESQLENVRLWYATYVCDHQFSIAHGRPPAAIDDMSIRDVLNYIDFTGTYPGDIRLVAQVSLFSILTQAYVAFDSRYDKPLMKKEIEKLSEFNAKLLVWHIQWSSLSNDCQVLGSYPSKNLRLYLYFAEFQVNSIALRGITPSNRGMDSQSEPWSADHYDAANRAISAAISTLRLILEDNDLRRAFPSVPIFTYTMVAFCATFLLKMAAIWWEDSPGYSSTSTFEIKLDRDHAVSLVQRSADMLSSIATNLNEKHIAKHIAAGMLEMLQQFHALHGETRTVDNPVTSGALDMSVLPAQSTIDNSFWTGDFNFHDLGGTFGFGLDETLLGQMAADSFEPWP